MIKRIKDIAPTVRKPALYLLTKIVRIHGKNFDVDKMQDKQFWSKEKISQEIQNCKALLEEERHNKTVLENTVKSLLNASIHQNPDADKEDLLIEVVVEIGYDEKLDQIEAQISNWKLGITNLEAYKKFVLKLES